MIYFSDQELDALLLEDAPRGDLTSRTLNLTRQPARMRFSRKSPGRVAGIDVAMAMLTKLGLSPVARTGDGDDVDAMTPLIEVQGPANLLHIGWKSVQVVLEWSCGVAQYTADMVAAVQRHNPQAVVACTRKSIPGTRKLATAAVLAGGGHIHRAGLSESVLVFSNHRNLLGDDVNGMVAQLKRQAPENKIAVEADDLDDLKALLPANPDIIQLDKFSVDEVCQAQHLLRQARSTSALSVAGGINRDNVADYAKTGINLFITSAPYYAAPQDIKVIIQPN
ncbi:molybdenum transport protein [Ferrimonas sediminum]|uniref:Putative pyrophosphorylase ModD n=1 Tax=Ferrimonas sediminum TaxID=718193 RepID=A0A1G8TVF9_9GAMM|nr:ModD protein [Ferrimonas sediminum]SDJ44710.1 molybdenum transport protein [Ferrimonas sediminum]